VSGGGNDSQGIELRPGAPVHPLAIARSTIAELVGDGIS
jgi:hypothetical protein